MTAKKRTKSTYSARRTSFSSLPDDVALNCLARISITHYPTLSLVSKGFRSLIASRKLYETRYCIGKTNTFLYVCLDLKITKHNPRWFMLFPEPKQQKLKLLPITWSPHQHPKSSAVVSNRSEIYILGGSLKKKASKKALVLDCRSHKWRTLPEMNIARVSAAANVIDGKIYVIGGSKCNRGEIYDPKTQTWEIITLDLTIQKSLVPGRLVMGGTVYDTDCLKKMICLVEIENVLCQISVLNGIVVWYEPNENLWCGVKGVTQLLPESSCLLRSVTYSGEGRRRVIVWWESMVEFRSGKGRHGTKDLKTDIWCAEISFERRDDVGELWGFVEWYNNVYTIYGCYYRSPLVLHSAIVSL